VRIDSDSDSDGDSDGDDVETLSETPTEVVEWPDTAGEQRDHELLPDQQWATEWMEPTSPEVERVIPPSHGRRPDPTIPVTRQLREATKQKTTEAAAKPGYKSRAGLKAKGAKAPEKDEVLLTLSKAEEKKPVWESAREREIKQLMDTGTIQELLMWHPYLLARPL